MNGLLRPGIALIAALSSAALGAVVLTSRADAAVLTGISLTATATPDPAGDAIDYAFRVANAGGPTWNDVSVDAVDFSGTGTPPPVSCPQPALPAGVSEICTASYQLTSPDLAADAITLRATVSGTQGTGGTATSPSSTAVFAVQHPTFIDSPDITNDDIGDLNKLPGGTAAIQTFGNSWNQAAENSVNWAYDTIASYQPSNYLISGDLVEGRWGEPGDTSGVFGPQSDPATRIQHMADFYQGENVRRLEDAGLFDKLYAIPGDHDYGDNWWRVDDPTGYGKIKYDNFHIWRDTFAKDYLSNADGSPRFADRPVGTQWDKTAYATMISPDMLLVSVDVFDRLDPVGDPNVDNVGNKVAVQVVDGQLAWFKSVLAGARAPGSPVKWIVVQGHVPVLTPVRVSHSSGMHLAGRTTAFWQTMKQYKVNLYLAGEVHATTRRSLNGITQITTGAPLEYTGQTTFVAVNEYADHLGLVDWGWNIPVNAPNPPSWDGACAVSAIEADPNACPPGRVVSMNYDYTGYRPTVEGTLSIGADNTADYGTGNLIEYVDPGSPPTAAEIGSSSLTNTVTPASVQAAGTPVSYAVTVTNTGTEALSNVKVTRSAFSGTGTKPVLSCPQHTLPVGVAETCAAHYTVTEADVAAGKPVSYTASETAVSPTGGTVTATPTTATLAMPALPALSLATSANPGSIQQAGSKITYSYAVKNTGNTALTGVRVSRRAHTGTGSWSTTTCPRSTLAAGARVTCTATYTPTQADIEAGTAITSTTAATGTGPAGGVSSKPSSISTPVAQHPSLTVTQTAGRSSVDRAGQQIGYRVAITNTGNLNLDHLTVAARFSGAGKHSAFTYRTRKLAPGARTTVTATYTVARADITAGKPLVSTSTVHGRRSRTSRTITSNSSRVSVAVK